MAERILSPGVFTQENDQSFVAQGISQIGAAFVGPTLKGQAFVPTIVTSPNDFVTQFGQQTPTSYIPYAVINYLNTAGVATVVRVLGDGGWSFNVVSKKLAAFTSGSTIISVLHPTQNVNDAIADLGGSFATGSLNSFNLTVSGSSVLKTASGSFNVTSNNYITKTFGNSPLAQSSSAFPYLLFQNYLSASVGVGSSSYNDAATLTLSNLPCTFTSSNPGGYQEAISPWIVSAAGQRLFRIHHISHGFAGNTDVKPAIVNIAPSTIPGVYSTFSFLLRGFNDTDNVPSIVEQFNNLTLNPNDNSSYIGFKIGDQYQAYDPIQQKVILHGEYPNSSDYIYLEIDSSVKNGALDPTIYPAGFEAVFETIAGFSGFSLPTASLIQSNSASVSYSGFDYTNADNLNYLNPIPKEATAGLNKNFVLNVSDSKFLIPMQGGTDGMNYATIKNTGKNITPTNLFGFDLSTSTSPGSLSYIQALNILSNDEAYDMNLLLLPGVINTLHPSVVQAAISMVTLRTDAVYLVDLCGSSDTIATAVQSVASLNSNYAATYYPWVKIIDSSNNKQMLVPPSVVIPQAFAYNDKVGQEWFAVAGLNRGGLGGVIGTAVNLSKADRDILYPARINPIANFPKTGIAIWGQKTLQLQATALDRINVRRLLINLRKFTASVAQYLVFEQNVSALWTSFKNKVTPYYSYVQSKSGVYAITVQMDDTNNTPSTIDQNELVGAIFVQPVKDAEFILLDFNISATGTII